MKKRTWKQALSGVGGAVLLLSVPTLALGMFTPRAMQSLTTATPPAGHIATALPNRAVQQQPVSRTDADQVTLGDDWAYTVTVLELARQDARNINTELAATRSQAASLLNKIRQGSATNVERAFYQFLLEKAQILVSARGSANAGIRANLGNNQGLLDFTFNFRQQLFQIRLNLEIRFQTTVLSISPSRARRG